MKSVQIRSYFWSVFSCIQTEYRKIRTRNNSVFGHFSRTMSIASSAHSYIKHDIAKLTCRLNFELLSLQLRTRVVQNQLRFFHEHCVKYERIRVVTDQYFPHNDIILSLYALDGILSQVFSHFRTFKSFFTFQNV